MKNLILMFAALSLLATTGCLKGKLGAEPKTDVEKTIYTLGQMDSRRLQNFDLTGHEFQVWVKGVKDGLDGETGKVDMQAFSKAISKLGDERSKQVAAAESKAAEGYLTKMKAEAGAEALPSGVIYRELKAGAGASPKKDSMVKVHYHGTLRDGTVFDSSVDRGNPATFPLNRVIPCWTEGVQKMKVGGKAKLTCPSKAAYGDRGAPPKIKPGAALSFEVELLEIVEKEKKK